MRIVSQNRGFSVEIDRAVLMMEDNAITCSSVDIKRDKPMCLGRYKNPARAQEVFGELHKKYSFDDSLFCGCEPSNELVKHLMREKHTAISTITPGSSIEVVKDRIYYMPEE